MVLRDGFAYIDYYTNAIERDYPWLLGMFLPTDIRMARIPLDALVALADERLLPVSEHGEMDDRLSLAIETQ